jgi:hypothetical protein
VADAVFLSSMLLRSMFTGAAFAVLAAAPASASTVMSPLKPCYVAAQEQQREFVTVQVGLGGFTPFSDVDVFLDSIQQESAKAAFDGSLTGMVQAPFPQTDQREFTLRLVQHDNAANTASAVSKVTRLAVEQVPAKASTGDRVRFKGRGFTAATPIYAHYVFAGKSVRTVRLGYPTGDCGLFSIKRKQFPFKKSPRVGVWTIQFDQELRYNPAALVRVPLTIKVKKTIRPRRAR